MTQTNKSVFFITNADKTTLDCQWYFLKRNAGYYIASATNTNRSLFLLSHITNLGDVKVMWDNAYSTTIRQNIGYAETWIISEA